MLSSLVFWLCLLPLSCGHGTHQIQSKLAREERVLAAMLLQSASALLRPEASVRMARIAHRAPEISMSSQTRRAALQAGVAGASVLVGTAFPAFADDVVQEDEAASSPTPTSEEPKMKAVELPNIAVTEDKTQVDMMGGVLTPATYNNKYCRLYRPSSWNEFTDGEGYAILLRDLVNQDSTVQVTISPIQSPDAKVDAIGKPLEVASKLAKGREIVSVKTGTAGDSPKYILEFKDDNFHEIQLLTINKARLYRVTATASTKAWPKNEKMYKTILASFVPNLG